MIPYSAATAGERKRAVYLCELDWDLVVACLKDRIQVEFVPKDALTLWRGGANRAEYIMDVIERGKVRTTEQARS